MFRKGILHCRVPVVSIIITTGFFCAPTAHSVTWDFQMYSSTTDPIVAMNFDAAGYSDWSYWGYHLPRHPHPEPPLLAHEMLSGEWAGAVHYDGIASGDEAMWLTDYFQWPNWEIFLFPRREYGIIERAIRREICLKVESGKN